MRKNKIEIIYGLHTSRHALEQSPESILEVRIQKDKNPSAELNKIIKLVEVAGIDLQEVSRQSLDNAHRPRHHVQM